ncbi:ATP synthase F1 subunit epsilon [Candidatus Uhrbacteria bacterium]|nr:ATP synthase F1 subunit epsilon [Candidatus Uhrbacteria bacterium]
MHFSIITPECVVYSDSVESITLPTQEGEITVLENHVPLVSILRAGELLIQKNKEIIPLAVSGGVVQVRKAIVTILADTAEKVEEIIEERAQEARRRAEAIIADKKFDAAEYATISAKMEKELARIKVARKWKKGASSFSSISPDQSDRDT